MIYSNKNYTISDYYQWDAIDSQGGIENSYNHKDSAQYSCSECVTLSQLIKVINEKSNNKVNVYWDNGDIGTNRQTYTVTDENGQKDIFHTGLWLKKRILNKDFDGTIDSSEIDFSEFQNNDTKIWKSVIVPQLITSKSNLYIRNNPNYFFLPANGYNINKTLHDIGKNGSYWTKTSCEYNIYSEDDDPQYAYFLYFDKHKVSVIKDYRDNGYMLFLKL